MGTVRKTITLTEQQDGWIKTQINAGHYTNDSEYIRDLIRPGYRRRSVERHAVYFRIARASGEFHGLTEAFRLK